MADEVSGTEAAVLGMRARGEIDAWVARAVAELTGSDVVEVRFRAGRIDVVHGVRTDDGRELVVKVHRPPVDIGARTAVADAQRALAEHGFPCARPVAGPAVVDGRVVSVETALPRGAVADGRDPAVRGAVAAGLAEVIDVLAGLPDLADLAARVGSPPPWCRYQGGPWPVPHDPIFDFTTTPDGYGWLDDMAGTATRALAGPRSDPVVVGHADWYCGNLLLDGTRIVAAVDWDLVADTAPVIAGIAAGGFLEGGLLTPEHAVGFLVDFAAAHGSPFTADQQRQAAAAVSWVVAFNARCDLALAGTDATDGAVLRMARERGREFAALRW